MSTVVHVNNISAQTSEQQVRDFFSFCGKISNLSVKSTSNEADAPKAATVTFEKDSAAKTALLLDNTQLGPSQVTVTSGASLGELAGAAGSSTTTGATASDPDSVDQEDKPRSRIAAEYLAHGYTLSDKALQRALELDQQHGISSRFTNALKSYDEKYKVSDKAKAADNQYGVTTKGQQLFAGLHSYFQKAADTPTGQKLVDSTRKVKDRLSISTTRPADLQISRAASPAPPVETARLRRPRPTGSRRQLFLALTRLSASVVVMTAPAPVRLASVPAPDAESRVSLVSKLLPARQMLSALLLALSLSQKKLFRRSEKRSGAGTNFVLLRGWRLVGGSTAATACLRKLA